MSRTMPNLLVLVVAGTPLLPCLAYAQDEGRRDQPGARILAPGDVRNRPEARGDESDAPVHVRIFRGTGLPKPQPEGPEGDPEPPPQALSMDRKLEILAAIGSSEPGTQYVRLTPSEPTVPWKGAFVFVAPRLVEGGQGYARFTQHSLPGAGPSRAVLWLHSANYRKYLIDCAVDGTYHTGGESELWGGGPVLTVAGPGSESQVFDFRQAWSPNGYHLVFGFEAGGAGWYSFTITSGASQPGTGVRWELHACEVTNL